MLFAKCKSILLGKCNFDLTLVIKDIKLSETMSAFKTDIVVEIKQRTAEREIVETYFKSNSYGELE